MPEPANQAFRPHRYNALLPPSHLVDDAPAAEGAALLAAILADLRSARGSGVGAPGAPLDFTLACRQTKRLVSASARASHAPISGLRCEPFLPLSARAAFDAMRLVSAFALPPRLNPSFLGRRA